MAPKSINKRSSGKVATGRSSANKQRSILKKTGHKTEESFRQEILHLLSNNFISPEFARLAWFESFENDLKEVRLNLETAERALSKESKSLKGKTQNKKKGTNGSE